MIYRAALPLAERDHPLERWLREAGRPLPEKPASAVKALSAPGPAPVA